LGSHRWAIAAEPDPVKWLNTVELGGSDLRDALSDEDQTIEYLMMGLRTSKGVSLNRFAVRESIEASVGSLVSEGLVDLHGDTLRCTPRGRVLLNEVLRRVLS